MLQLEASYLVNWLEDDEWITGWKFKKKVILFFSYFSLQIWALETCYFRNY